MRKTSDRSRKFGMASVMPDARTASVMTGEENLEQMSTRNWSVRCVSAIVHALSEAKVN